jgi:hypothetical protein
VFPGIILLSIEYAYNCTLVFHPAKCSIGMKRAENDAFSQDKENNLELEQKSDYILYFRSNTDNGHIFKSY